MIVRWGLAGLAPLLEELAFERPLLVTSARFADLELPVVSRFAGVRRHAPIDVVAAATDAAASADGLVGLGGGSAIDTAKAVSATTGLRLVAVPTTYAGSEWTAYFGMRDEGRRQKTGGSGAQTVAIVYEPELTLGLPREESVGTAMNALAHAAEALYAGACEDASVGSRLIGTWLPVVADNGENLEARARLLEGAMHAGIALSERGMFLAHAMAQALGGRFGVSHGAMNALCLAPALRFNAPVVPHALAALADALEVADPAARAEDLARLGGFERLRDHGVPEDELAAVAASAAERPPARANPRPATAADIESLLRSIW
ncbi:MAG TPA: iron-containing alcohol dehydrogenase [Gaiellaceae bacterium]|nr:iron-containing alcohol dehydrogenase [Gaiellaceae bacterium]